MNNLHLAIQDFKPSTSGTPCRVIPLGITVVLNTLPSKNRSRSEMYEIVITVVTHHYGKTFDELLVKTRRQEILKPRQIMVYLLRMYAKMSSKRLGAILGFDHSTLLHASQAVQNYIDTDEEYRTEVNTIKRKIIE